MQYKVRNLYNVNKDLYNVNRHLYDVNTLYSLLSHNVDCHQFGGSVQEMYANNDTIVFSFLLIS